MARGKRNRKRKSWRERGPIDRLTIVLRMIVRAAGLVIVASVVWVLVYRFAEPPGTLLMVERSFAGETITKSWASLEEVSPHLVSAVIASEDTRFCLHSGFDFEAIDEAFKAARNGDRLRGASTISQQTAKNAFLWDGRNWARKGAEAWMTVLIEAMWSKRRIMEVYLNIAEWGDGAFGIEAAAQKRFGKRAKALTRHEAALLATVLPNPKKWRVDPPGRYVRQRVRTVRGRMKQVERDGLDNCVLG